MEAMLVPFKPTQTMTKVQRCAKFSTNQTLLILVQKNQFKYKIKLCFSPPTDQSTKSYLAAYPFIIPRLVLNALSLSLSLIYFFSSPTQHHAALCALDLFRVNAKNRSFLFYIILKCLSNLAGLVPQLNFFHQNSTKVRICIDICSYGYS